MGGIAYYNGRYWESLPERGTFFRRQVYKRVGISLVNIYIRIGRSLIAACKKGPNINGFTDAVYGCEKAKKIHGLAIFSKYSAFTAVQRK